MLQITSLNRSLHAAKQDEFCTQHIDIQKEVEAYLKKLISTSYDGSPLAGQMTLFPEHTEGNGKRLSPKSLAFIVDHVKDELDKEKSSA